MKKLLSSLLFIIACSFIVSNVSAQSNLQFNRAIFQEITYTTPSNSVPSTTTQTLTVPAGKVWKIESASGNYRSTSSTAYAITNVQLALNDKLIYTGTSSTALYNYFPIWLPAGTYTLTLGFTASVQGYLINGNISGIEFNLTQ